jgi:hypothetical protein
MSLILQENGSNYLLLESGVPRLAEEDFTGPLLMVANVRDQRLPSSRPGSGQPRRNALTYQSAIATRGLNTRANPPAKRPESRRSPGFTFIPYTLPPATSLLLLEDNASHILLESGAGSRLGEEGTPLAQLLPPLVGRVVAQKPVFRRSVQPVTFQPAFKGNVYLYDTFQGANGTPLWQHTADSGASWNNAPVYLDGNGYCYGASPCNELPNCAEPPSQNFTVQFDLNRLTSLSGLYAGLVLLRPSDGSFSSYIAFLYIDGYGFGWYNTGTLLASSTTRPIPGAVWRIRLDVQISGSNTLFNAYYSTNFGATWTPLLSYSTATPTLVPAVAIYPSGTGSTATTGTHIGRLLVQNLPMQPPMVGKTIPCKPVIWRGKAAPIVTQAGIPLVVGNTMQPGQWPKDRRGKTQQSKPTVFAKGTGNTPITRMVKPPPLPRIQNPFRRQRFVPPPLRLPYVGPPAKTPRTAPPIRPPIRRPLPSTAKPSTIGPIGKVLPTPKRPKYPTQRFISTIGKPSTTPNVGAVRKAPPRPKYPTQPVIAPFTLTVAPYAGYQPGKSPRQKRHDWIGYTWTVPVVPFALTGTFHAEQIANLTTDKNVFGLDPSQTVYVVCSDTDPFDIDHSQTSWVLIPYTPPPPAAVPLVAPVVAAATRTTGRGRAVYRNYVTTTSAPAVASGATLPLSTGGQLSRSRPVRPRRPLLTTTTVVVAQPSVYAVVSNPTKASKVRIRPPSKLGISTYTVMSGTSLNLMGMI